MNCARLAQLSTSSSCKCVQTGSSTLRGCGAGRLVFPRPFQVKPTLRTSHTGRKDLICTAIFRASNRATEQSPQDLASKLFELAQSGSQPDTAMVSSLGNALEKHGSSFGPAEIANTLWAIAKLGLKVDPKILTGLVGLVSVKAHSFKPAQIAAVLWALGTIGQSVDSKALGALGGAIRDQASKFDPHSLVDALWGFATLGGKLDGGTIGSLARSVKNAATSFNPKQAANALWALVKLDQDNGGNAIKAIATIGGGAIAINAIKGALGGGRHADESVKHDDKSRKTEQKQIDEALQALSKSGADAKTIKAMQDAARDAYKKAGHDDHVGSDVVDALATLRGLGHAPEEKHHSGGILAGLFGKH